MICFIEYKGEKIATATISPSNEYGYGDKVYAIRNTNNYGISISEVIISSPSILIKTENMNRSFIQCDLTINDGNSGGDIAHTKSVSESGCGNWRTGGLFGR